MGEGSPFPWMRFVVVGRTISSERFSGTRSWLSSIGTSIRVPHSACNEIEIEVAEFKLEVPSDPRVHVEAPTASWGTNTY